MKNLFSLVLLFLLSCSCTAPRVITKIFPEAPEGNFAMGREYIPLESDQIRTELGFDGIQGENLVFDFLVHNGGLDTLSILPDSFFYVVLDSADAHSSLDSSWLSVHPDTVMMHYDLTLEGQKELKGMNTFIGILMASVDILFNASGFIATENPAYIVDAVFQTAGTADQFISQGKAISSEMEMINEEKEQVREEIYRTSNLPPGTVKSGYVYFPLHEQTPYYMFCFPIGNQEFQFVYRQQKELVY